MINHSEGDRLPPSSPPHRATRLRRQAENCIDLALQTDDAPFAADLIDEATRLALRAREISVSA